MTKLWNDEAGAVLSAELVLVLTIVVIGVLVGLKALQAAVVTELTDVAGAVGSLNQSYSYGGIESCGAAVAGSAFQDTTDGCADALDSLDLNVNATPEW